MSARSLDNLPIVSVITPSFNQAPFLADTLQSVAMQDYPAVEHIVMDGGSSDGSVEIIRGWAERHPVRWVSEADEGQADAIQRAAQLASGEIVAWLNSDDVYLDPKVLSDVVEVFRSTDATIVTGAGWYLSETGQRLRHIPVYPDRVDHATLRCVDWLLQPATFFRREVFLQYPIDTTLHYAFDWDFFIRVTAAHTPIPVDRDIAGYRLHESGKTVSGGARRQRELLKVTERYHRRASLRYAAVLAFTAAHLLAQRLPLRVYRPIAGWLNAIAMMSQKLTNGRGIQP